MFLAYTKNNEEKIRKQKRIYKEEEEQYYENEWVYYSFIKGFVFTKDRRDKVLAIAQADSIRKPDKNQNTIHSKAVHSIGYPTGYPDWKDTPIGSEEEFLEKCKANVDFERGYAALVDSINTEGSGGEPNKKIVELLTENRALNLENYRYPNNYNGLGITYLILSVAIKGSDKSIPNRFAPSGKMKLRQSNDEEIIRFKNEAVKAVLGNTPREFNVMCKESAQTATFWSNVAYRIIKTNLDPNTREFQLPTPITPIRPNGKQQLKHSNAPIRNWQESKSWHLYFIEERKSGTEFSYAFDDSEN